MKQVCLSWAQGCVLTWDGIAAVGTLGAVAVALWLARRDAVRRREEQVAKTMWVRLMLVGPLKEWDRNLSFAQMSARSQDLLGAVEGMKVDPRTDAFVGRLSPPQALLAHLPELEQLGQTGIYLQQAIYASERLTWIARRVRDNVLSSPSKVGDPISVSNMHDLMNGLLGVAEPLEKGVEALERDLGPLVKGSIRRF